jgi:hypothetical protein
LRRWRADLQISYSKLKDECDELAPENIRKQNEEDKINAIKKETLDDSGNVLMLSPIKPEADDSWISTGGYQDAEKKEGDKQASEKPPPRLLFEHGDEEKSIREDDDKTRSEIHENFLGTRICRRSTSPLIQSRG